MGYQLYWGMLCAIVDGGAVGVTPKGHGAAAESAATCGGTPGVQVLQTPATVVLHTGAVPAELNAPGSVLLRLRSAGSCNKRMAFGLTGFDPAPVGPGAVGAVNPRANPSCSHSLVTGCQIPDASLYSTRNHPSIRFQDVELARLEGAAAFGGAYYG